MRILFERGDILSRHMSIAVRRLGPGDEETARRVASTFKSARLSRRDASAFLANPAHYLLVAEVSGSLAGFLLAYRLDRLDRSTSQLFVYEVDVLPEHRGRGVGTSLMESVRSLVDAEGLEEAFVITNRNNAAAVALYRGTGGQIEDDGAVLFVYPGRRTPP